MACMTLVAPSVTMATTQLARVVRCEPAVPAQYGGTTEHTPLRMSWVVVTGKDGAARLRMRWTESAPNR